MKRPFLRSLTGQLTLAFVLLSLITLGLVGIFSFVFTRNEYSDLLTGQIQAQVARELQTYFATHRTVKGFRSGPGSDQDLLPSIGNRADIPPDPPGRRMELQEGGPFILLDSTWRTLKFTLGYPVGSVWPDRARTAAIPVNVPGQTAVIAYLLPTGHRPPFDLRSAAFLNTIQQAILLVMVVASLIAALMGVVLARTLLLPLRQLLRGLQAMQSGRSVEPLPALRQDEMGELLSAFNLMSQEVIRNQRARRQLTADIAHDLNTPLSVISGSLEGMLDGTFAVNQVRLERLQHQTLHITSLIRDLRFLALADAGELSLQKHPVDLTQVLSEIARTFEQPAAQQGVELLHQLPERPQLMVVDPTRITQVMQNLLSNALEHTPTGGRVEIQGLVQESVFQISVQDTGSGVPAEMVPYVFERLYRANASRHSGGSGLGLTISRSIIEAHGGQMRIESQEGEGTVVTFSLPLESHVHASHRE
ncbi:sensor histidine kinase [Deinococcus ruber]|uniref:histidine kinase n=1 Tax=Deinococcus ruber TaxID=1848197 RepID=A0A918FCU9_9DEIO|nr:HAMP domain-containing sensor histidine kinase [Deinococcus ruber]GGR23258.1 two-component sensor histidine kinase [Deinococcus ruber]